MKISKKKLQQIIKEEYQRFIKEQAVEATHRCMDGSMVASDSQGCYDDILNRIEDAEWNRGSHSCGTEDRVYYNGLLKGLRNKRNRLKKVLIPPMPTPELTDEIE
jgi:hypothetical protein